MSAAGADEHLEISNFIMFQNSRSETQEHLRHLCWCREIEIQKGLDIWDPTDIT